MKHRIVYQGIPGAFSHIAALGHFGADNTFSGLPTFHEIFARIENRQADYGVIPLENSLAGSIGENYDLLYKHDVSVIDEYYQPIRHHVLISKSPHSDKTIGIQNIQRIYSHAKALEQCIKFFKNHDYIAPQAYNDTAEAAEYVASEQRTDIAAIASKEAAELYGLDILVRDVQDNINNWTRFFIITSVHPEPDILVHDTVYKCSIIFTLPHIPGSLYDIIGIFANAHLNLSKIESRPIHGKAFEYVFYIDVEFHSHDYTLIHKLIRLCSEMTNEIKVLGYYPKAHIKNNF